MFQAIRELHLYTDAYRCRSHPENTPSIAISTTGKCRIQHHQYCGNRDHANLCEIDSKWLGSVSEGGRDSDSVDVRGGYRGRNERWQEMGGYHEDVH